MLAFHSIDMPFAVLPGASSEARPMPLHLRLLLTAFIVLNLMSGTAAPQAGPPAGMPGPDPCSLPNRDTMNATSVTIITAPAGGATAIFGSDMARVLDDGNIRVLPVL